MDKRAQECMDFVKGARHRCLTREERLDILRLQAYFLSEGAHEISRKVATALGRSHDVVKSIVREYNSLGTVTVATPASNTTNHSTRVPDAPDTVQLVQAFVRERRATRSRTTAVDVMVYLREMGVMDFDMANKVHESSALRAVQRFLQRHGYKRGNRKGSSTYHLSKMNVAARDSYVQLMRPHIQSASRPPIVYTDESFIHHHYKSHGDSLYDPNDTLDKVAKEKHKGQRYCFIAGILDSPSLDSCVLGLDIFTGGKARAKEPKDYHGMFNHAYYVNWFGKLLDEMDERGIANALIVMDNAKYHKGRPDDTPSSRMRKARLQAECVRFGVEFSDTDFRGVLWQKLSLYIQAHVNPVVVDMAHMRGHTVVYTPPHHSDLQPIEMVWAIVKGDAGRRYDTTTKFAQVKTRIDAAFAALTPSAIKGCVKVAEGKLQSLYDHLVKVDAMSSDDESSAESDNDNEEEGCDSS